MVAGGLIVNNWIVCKVVEVMSVVRGDDDLHWTSNLLNSIIMTTMVNALTLLSGMNPLRFDCGAVDDWFK